MLMILFDKGVRKKREQVLYIEQAKDLQKPELISGFFFKKNTC